eukprot:8945647-Karenia_brevis.AAC.1
MRALSAAVIFIDLSKAFDFAIREILLGWRSSYNISKISWLQRMGLSKAAAEAAAQAIDSIGGLLETLGMPEGALNLMGSLHEGS